eukprot:10445747-Alexandrium_andersonii.AAC.1
MAAVPQVASGSWSRGPLQSRHRAPPAEMSAYVFAHVRPGLPFGRVLVNMSFVSDAKTSFGS